MLKTSISLKNSALLGFGKCAFAILICFSQDSQAQIAVATPQTAGVTPIISWKSGVVTTKDLEADALRLPANERLDTLKNPRMLLQVIDNLHVYREFATRAKAEGTITPEMQLSMAIAAERHLGLMYLAQRLQAFQDKLGDLTPAAKEHYEVNKSKYDKPERVNASHILISPRAGRTPEQAQQIAQRIRAQIATGSDFSALAAENSDDTSTKLNGGRLGAFARKEMVKPIEDAVFKLEKKGELTPVVQTQFGYHVVQLNFRIPAGIASFEDVKDEILDEIASKAVTNHRDTLVSEIRNDPSLKINEERFEVYTGAKPTRKAK